jgi:hypothetical protein
MRHRPFAPRGNDDPSLADWLEACMFILETNELSRADILRLLTNEPLDDGDFGVADAVEDEEVEEVVAEDGRVDRLVTSIDRRAKLAPDIYPFRFSDEFVTQTESDAGCVYLFLLWLTVPRTRFRNDENLDYPERVFDAVAAVGICALLGEEAVAMLFARKHADDESSDPHVRPVSFPDAIVRIRQIMQTYGLGLPPNDPDAVPEGLPARTYQDGGVDVIAWRPFRDERPGFPVALAQATIQSKWHGKDKDVVENLWEGWVIFPTPFQRILVIPWAASHESTWLDRNRIGGLIIDRMRLCELLERRLGETAALCTDELCGWLNAERDAYEREDAAA